ncbi:MAG: peptidase S41 [Candidatus Aminicenantes bacterium]|mgnify:CR=1 FL=1|nr:PD40 domain-containing protein [Candidatus Aminicenantes bacterium]RLE04725.1 MAG: peptidase S41 [Candidatus Aminicenantes bacterium]
MKQRGRWIFSCFGLIVLLVLPLAGINVHDTKMMAQPTITQGKIAFVYANDLWICDWQGHNVRRLTSHPGIESVPVFSPDGRWVAFSGEYDGNVDVYLVPAEGGLPRRLTWHPGADIVRGFTPDGQKVIFISTRNSFTRAHNKLFAVPLSGGMPEELPLPYVFKATFSPDGQKIAYVPLREAFHQWKHYRGGTVSTIWIIRLSDLSVEKIPQPEGRCNDTDPMWVGDKIYFRSDRAGEFNLFVYETTTGKITQLTHYDDFPVLSASAGAGRIVFERAGHLFLFNPDTRKAERLTIGVAADLLELRPRYVQGEKYIRSGDLSPSGARAVFGFRGEIITVPAKKGDFRNLTNSPGAHDRFPVWSPDGSKIAYFSDASGEYKLYVIDQKGQGSPQSFALPGAGFYDSPVWSPDSQKITFTDNSWSLFWIDLATGRVKKIASEYLYGPAGLKTIRGVWSPDSRWIAYTLNTKAYIQKVYVYSLEEDKSYPITDGLSEVSEPVFDPSGKYLYFFASTDAGPVKHWFAMSNADMRMTKAIYLAVLAKDVPSPLAKESDEEPLAQKEKKDKKEKPSSAKTTSSKNKGAVRIDFAGLNHRILALPLPVGNYFNLRVGGEGQIYYLEAPATARGPYQPGTKLHYFNLKKRQDQVLAENIRGFIISANGKKILYMARNQWGIVEAGKKFRVGEGKLNTASIKVRIEPQAEWRQIFYEAWRINRDYFYDPFMHGIDWPQMKKKYEVFLEHLACRADLNRVIQWMCSELGVGHHRVAGGDTLARAERIPGGLLGADYEIAHGRYRFKKVYGGLNWNPELRSPLTEPGVDVQAGEYLLAVNGREVVPPDNLYKYFENTAGKIVEITVGPNPDGTQSRTVKVVPIASEYALRNRDWVEANIRKVDKATNGRVAYVYVPNTTTLGHTYFKRYFFPQSHKEAIIVDERFNGGGQVADYYIDILRRPFLCMWAMRYGADLKTPSASIQGPKVMLINESAGSGGDLLPWMFRQLKLGKLIGKRTWGGLVGILGFPVLMDGGYVTAPNLAIWTEEGWVVENEGVPPDIEVEQWPAEVAQGHDPQLEKAIEVILEELRRNPPKKLTRPPYKKIKR